MTQDTAISDVLIIGAGPGGGSCALWLAQQGIACTLLEAGDAPCANLRALDLAQNWVLGHPNTSTAALADLYTRHLVQEPLIDIRCNVRVTQALDLRTDLKRLRLSDGSERVTRALVLATGLRSRRFPGDAADAPIYAEQLTRQRQQLRGQRVLLLGGGDNAVENALYLAEQDNQVLLWHRGPLRAQDNFKARLAQAVSAHLQRIEQRAAMPMPTALARAADGRWRVHSAQHGEEIFDQVAVLFGYEPEDETWQILQAGPAWTQSAWPRLPIPSAAPLQAHGLFLAGDISQRLHPSIQPALADGVTAARQVAAWLRAPTAAAPRKSGSGAHILTLTGLRFDANLGILDHEKTAPQPIQVDAELNLGPQPLEPRDDDIMHVLDYRKIRQIIIDECQREHVNLLESMIGKLAQRLLRLPGVLGVRVKIVKLEIFEDCEVAIRAETGQW